jgi:hypothetical protein
LLAAADATGAGCDPQDATVVRAKVLLGLGWLYGDQGLALFADSAEHARAARAALVEATTVLEASRDMARLGGGLFILGTIEAEEDNSLAAETALTRSIELYHRRGARVGETKAVGRRSYVTLNRGDYSAARAHLIHWVAWARAEGLSDLPKWLHVLGRLSRAEGQADEAWRAIGMAQSNWRPRPGDQRWHPDG